MGIMHCKYSKLRILFLYRVIENYITAEHHLQVLQASTSINHKEHTPGGASPHPPYNVTPKDYPGRVSIEAPF